MPPKLSDIRINLVEESGWKPYDPGGRIMEWASDNAYEEFRSIDVSYLADFLDDIVTKAPQERKRWGPREEPYRENLEFVAEAVREGEPELDTVRQVILDALTWAWEEAYMPDDGDVELAMERVYEKMDWDIGSTSIASVDLWSEFLEEEKGPKVAETKRWGTRFREADVVEDLFKRVRYERKPKAWDRYLVFTWKESPVVEVLERFASVRKLGGRRAAAEALNEVLEDFSNEYMAEFWKQLSEIMGDVDVANRVDFRKHWQGMLRDPDVSLATAAEEIGQYARKAEAT